MTSICIQFFVSSLAQHGYHAKTPHIYEYYITYIGGFRYLTSHFDSGVFDDGFTSGASFRRSYRFSGSKTPKRLV